MCGAGLPPNQRICPYCGAARPAHVAGILAHAGRIGASLAILALGAAMVWWILPLANSGSHTEPDAATLVESATRETQAIAAQILTQPEDVSSRLFAAQHDPGEGSSEVEPISTITETEALPVEAAVSAVASPEESIQAEPTVLTYTVASGDVPGTIALQHGISLESLLEANGLGEGAVLQIGDVLIVPTPPPDDAATAALVAPSGTPAPTDEPAASGPFVHVVAAGDTLGALAVRYQVDSSEIAAENSLSLNTVLRIGQELIIPASGVLAVATDTPQATPTETPSPSATASPTSGPTMSGTAASRPNPSPTASRPNPTGVDRSTPSNRATQTPTVTSTPSPTATPAPTLRVHVVAPGQHIGVIAAIYDLSMQDIAEANGIGVSDILQVGQELLIPGPDGAVPPQTTTPSATATEATSPAAGAGTSPSPEATAAPAPEVTPAPQTHVIQQGDTLGGLAVRYQVSSEEIARANNLSLNSVLTIGQELVIPGVAAEPTAGPTASPTSASVSPEISSTPTPFPYRTRPQEMAYRQPRLLTPVNGMIFSGEASSIVLQWTSVGILGADEWYQVRLWTPDGGAEPEIRLTRSTSWRLSTELYPSLRRSDRFLWDVAVVRLLDTAPGYEELSVVSVQRAFRWR